LQQFGFPTVTVYVHFTFVLFCNFLLCSIDDDASLALTESQHSFVAAEEEGGDGESHQPWELDPNDRRPSLDSQVDGPGGEENDMVFLTGVDQNTDTNNENCDNVHDPEGQHEQEDTFSEPFVPQNSTGIGRFSQISPRWENSNLGRPPLVSNTSRFNAQTVRSIPIPDRLKVPPLKALSQSVSTLDILIAKSNYPNIHSHR
jgi:hypothetical protein